MFLILFSFSTFSFHSFSFTAQGHGKMMSAGCLKKEKKAFEINCFWNIKLCASFCDCQMKEKNEQK